MKGQTMISERAASYTVRADPEGWTAVDQEWRQIVEQPLGGGLHLVTVLVRRGERASVREARIEHRYRTRREGWKRKTVRRLNPRDVAIEGLCVWLQGDRPIAPQ
jgi:hypothetical protein